ncbi:MAG: hypothetical protein KQA31_02805 [Candidatus Aenigmarchaeota archaeon]|nr:hypothetical protein [Candidatus Aenigmarchaeota archaeon]
MKKAIIMIFLIFLNSVFAQNFDVWSERGGSFTIGRSEKIIIYVKNNGATVDTYTVTFTKTASYQGMDVSNSISFQIPSNKITDVQPGETVSTVGTLVILGPITSGSITLRISNQAGNFKTYTLDNIKATYPQSLFEFNTYYLAILLVLSLILFIKRPKLLILLFLPFSLVQAGYITITTSAEFPYIFNNSTQGYVIIQNSGDEIAKDCIVSIDSGYFSSYSYIGDISPNQEITKNITLIINNQLKDGTYISSLKTYYKDSNGYSFSAITPLEIVYKTPAVSKVSVFAQNIKIEEGGSKNLQIKLKNSDFRDQKVILTIHLPDEIIVEKNTIDVSISSNDEKTIIFPIKSYNALKGSKYAYFISAEYEDLYHYSSYSIGFIEIIDKEKIKPAYILAFIALIISIIMFLFTKRKTKKR